MQSYGLLQQLLLPYIFNNFPFVRDLDLCISFFEAFPLSPPLMLFLAFLISKSILIYCGHMLLLLPFFFLSLSLKNYILTYSLNVIFPQKFLMLLYCVWNANMYSIKGFNMIFISTKLN